MATNSIKSFERVFPTRELFKKKSLRSLLWSLAASFCLCLLLVHLFLIADLLVSRGMVPADSIALDEFQEFIQQPEVEGELSAVKSISPLEENGIFPAVWSSRHRIWGKPLKALYNQVSLLQVRGPALLLLVLSAVVVELLRQLFLARARRLATLSAADNVARIRRALHRQALRLGPGDIQDSNQPRALPLFTEDTEEIRQGVYEWIYRVGRYSSSLVLFFVVALAIHWRVALQCLIPLAGCWYFIQREFRRSSITHALAEARAESELRLLAEAFRKTRIIRGYGMESSEHDHFQKHLERYRERVLSVKKIESFSRWISRVSVTICVGIVIFLIGNHSLQNPVNFSVAAAVVLAVTFGSAYLPLGRLAELPEIRQKASLAADRIYRYLNQVPDVSQAVGAKFLEPVSESIRFESVSYGLSSRTTLLDNLDLQLPAGKVYSFISTNPLQPRALAYMLTRFIEPRSGRLLYDGEDIAWATLESLRAETTYVGGTDPFFTGTILENITCNNSSYSKQSAVEAAKESHANNFIMKLEQGYETILGEHGERLDAGQAFRLGLARAILRNPAVMIIEEPESKLDSDTKSLLDDTYNRIARGRTIIFLPTRLSTLRRSDQIVLIDKGKVEAIGNYSKLVKTCPLYQHYEYVMFNEFSKHEAIV